ncbi:hypothetical protein HNR39_000847 [Glaciimonas immobilis]|uniref:Uncharacterized protein n=1 Tax=Glaciimonas immobilis TaxID=728004 RepID=A0A840RL98_9BURK|nr:hypothetical protein [Glaciimonas immobilis]
MAHAVHVQNPGPQIEMRYTAMPSQLADGPETAVLFSTNWMTHIERFGLERAQRSTQGGAN